MAIYRTRVYESVDAIAGGVDMSRDALTLREIQMGSYGVLKRISKICSDHNWKWFLTYGTLIGAVRHKGIIPWDDDIDIMMPRPDYEELKKYFIKNKEALYPLKLFDKVAVRKYPHMIARVSDQRYHLVFENEVDYGIGLFVDIYPLDGVGNDLKKAIRLTRKAKKQASLCFLTSRKRFATDNTESRIKMLIKKPAYIWAKLMGNQHYINKLNSLAQTYSYADSEYVACVAWPVGNKYGRERDVFKKYIFETTMIAFEDDEFPAPKGYDKFLSITYGDYMKPPSEAGKKTHHTYKAYKR